MSDCEEGAANNFTHQQKKQCVEPGEKKPHTFGYSDNKVAHKVFMMLQLLLIKKKHLRVIFTSENQKYVVERYKLRLLINYTILMCKPN